MMTDHEPRVARPGGAPVQGAAPDEPFYRRGEQARRWGALLLLVGVVWLVFALTARGPLFGLGFIERSGPIEPQAFTAERVVINGLNDDVTLVPADGEQIVLAGERHAFGWSGAAAEQALEQLEVAATLRGDTLTIEVRRPSLNLLGRAPYAALRVALPEGVAAEAQVVSGDLAAEGLSGDVRLVTVSGSVATEATVGPLEIRTTSGDVRVAGHAGSLDVETTSGEVEADGALASPRLASVSGDLDVSGAEGAVEARSISGDISVGAAEGATLRIESTSGDVRFAGSLADGARSTIGNISGDVEVRLAAPADLRLELSTVSGELESDLELTGLARDRRSLRGAAGDGSGDLTISTTSGDVLVREE